jgi:hypothetical protein
MTVCERLVESKLETENGVEQRHMTKSSEQLAAELYDLSVPDWDGKFDFQRELARTVFEERIVYGDFFRNPLNEQSSETIWVARKP